MRIGAAGSCFAQHLKRFLESNGVSIVDVEPPPPILKTIPDLIDGHGYGVYSARFGNIYTVRQLLQLLREASGELAIDDSSIAWQREDGRWIDAFRPAVPEYGLGSLDEVIALRRHHVDRVWALFSQVDVMIFTLGLTEYWLDEETGLAYSAPPGVKAGTFDAKRWTAKSLSFADLVEDFGKVQSMVGASTKWLLTVSPVPLTATATGQHVLVANTRSKSTLRAFAADVAESDPNVDYFPSYEIVTNPNSRGTHFMSNMREVEPAAVARVMHEFRRAQPRLFEHEGEPESSASADTQCEDALLEAFAPGPGS